MTKEDELTPSMFLKFPVIRKKLPNLIAGEIMTEYPIQKTPDSEVETETIQAVEVFNTKRSKVNGTKG